MRRRLMGALAGIAVLALALYAGPRTLVIADLVRSQEERITERSADLMAQSVNRRIDDEAPLSELSFVGLIRSGERLTIELADGSRYRVGDVDGATHTARRGLSDGGTLTLELGTDVIDRAVADALTPVVLTAAAVVLASLLVASLLSRRLARPFNELVTYAETLSDEQPTPAPRAGVREADELATALERSSARVRELLRREREFSANASHQLRTPLAALRLRLEDLTSWPEVTEETRDELVASLGEVDRLAGTITDLLELARSGGLGGWERVDVLAAASGAVERWGATYAEGDRRLLLAATAQPAVVGTSERSLRQILDVLVENALVHGTGTVDVHVERAADHVAVRVADEGSMDRDLTTSAFGRSVRSPSSTGSGIGLALAQTIAEAAGARLSVVSRTPTVFELRLPDARIDEDQRRRGAGDEPPSP